MPGPGLAGRPDPDEKIASSGAREEEDPFLEAVVGNDLCQVSMWIFNNLKLYFLVSIYFYELFTSFVCFSMTEFLFLLESIVLSKFQLLKLTYTIIA